MSCTTAQHELVKSDAAAWRALRLVGRQYVPEDEDGPEFTAELRDCACGSTLALVVPTTDEDRSALTPAIR